VGIKITWILSFWIPAFAGMTVIVAENSPTPELDNGFSGGNLTETGATASISPAAGQLRHNWLNGSRTVSGCALRAG